jgi:hypothetical protein
MTVGSSRQLDLFRRLLAGGSAALVLMLSLLAVSPEAHEALHACDHDLVEEACPVVLFAAGVELPPVAPVVVAPTPVAEAPAAVRETIVFLSEPRYLRQPERGPPGRA